MRRKLIQQDVFERMVSESVVSAHKELVESQSILAQAAKKDRLSLISFTENTALFQTPDRTYIHAAYKLDENTVSFSNIEELAIDEQSAKAARRNKIAKMFEAVMLGNEEAARKELLDIFSNVNWNEAKDCEDKLPDFMKKGKKDDKEDAKHDDEKKEKLFVKAKKVNKDLAEAYNVSQNVLDYVRFMKVGPTLAEAASKFDDKGNLISLSFANSVARINNAVIRNEWKNLHDSVAKKRQSVAALLESQDFCKAVANLKLQNSFSDVVALEEALDSIVQAYPQVLYATQGELQNIFAEALKACGVKSFDDQTCEFMAEAVLQRAFVAYNEKAQEVLHLAGTELVAEEDGYIQFRNVTESFYSKLDEKFGLEKQAFVDLYESLRTVYELSQKAKDSQTCREAAGYLNDLSDVLNGVSRPQLGLVEEAASYLSQVIESNLEMGVWNVSNTAYTTRAGEHPDMATKASKSYTPSKDFPGGWGDSGAAISSDDNTPSAKNAKEQRDNSWGNEGGSDCYPNLTNPYIPKSFGDYTMKGEKGVDKDSANYHTNPSGSDTYPNLKNPYLPKEDGGPAGKGYKMKNGPGTDLVVDC